MTVIEYWVNPDAAPGGDGSKEMPKDTIHRARSSQQASDLFSGMKYRGGIVHLMGGVYRRGFTWIGYPKNEWTCNPGGQVISDRCMASIPPLWKPGDPFVNANYFPDDNRLIYEGPTEGDPAILTAFKDDPTPGSPPEEWGPQGGPGINFLNVARVAVNGHFKLEIHGGLPEPIFVQNDHESMPADDIFIREVVIRFVTASQIDGLADIARTEKIVGRKVWLENCIIDPDGTMTEADIKLAATSGSVARFGAGLVNARIA